MVQKWFEVWCQSAFAAKALSNSDSQVRCWYQGAFRHPVKGAPHKFCAVDIFGGSILHHTSHRGIPNFINQNWNALFLVIGHKPILVYVMINQVNQFHKAINWFYLVIDVL